MLRLNKEDKEKFMSSILLKYLPREELSRAKRDKEYKQKIISNYQPLNRELYTLDPTFFLLPSFLNAINENIKESIRSIISTPSPSFFVFQMFQPSFCKMMLSEVENIRKWVNQTKFRIKKTNAMSKYGVVLDDFGLDGLLDELMERFIRPISTEFFPNMCGSTLDSHHGFVVEYGEDRDVDLVCGRGPIFPRCTMKETCEYGCKVRGYIWLSIVGFKVSNNCSHRTS